MNNLALGYKISMPLHIVFKSAGLLINMLMGYWLMKKRYSIEYFDLATLMTFELNLHNALVSSNIFHLLIINKS
jgi:hypothetical protein